MSKLQEIIALAEAATPGPWKSIKTPQKPTGPMIIDCGAFAPGRIAYVVEDGATEYLGGSADTDAAFIAASDPTTVKALVRVVRAGSVLASKRGHADSGFAEDRAELFAAWDSLDEALAALPVKVSHD